MEKLVIPVVSDDSWAERLGKASQVGSIYLVATAHSKIASSSAARKAIIFVG